MPERPELDYVVPILRAEIVGRTVVEAQVHDPVVLRVAVLGDARELLTGRVVEGVERRAHFVMFALSGAPPLELAVHPMLAGRFTLCPASQRITKDTAFVLVLDDCRHLRYRDDKQMGKVYLLDPGGRAQVPGLPSIGIDVLGPAFTPAASRALAKKRKDQLKPFMMDKAALDSMGNAFADEAMWAAGLHPKVWVRKLGDDQLDRLRDAIVQTLGDACAEVARRAPPIDEKVRDFLGVRNRKGQPCPKCNTTIRTCGVHGHDAFFCPQCQPDDRGAGFVDWRRTGGVLRGGLRPPSVARRSSLDGGRWGDCEKSCNRHGARVGGNRRTAPCSLTPRRPHGRPSASGALQGG